MVTDLRNCLAELNNKAGRLSNSETCRKTRRILTALVDLLAYRELDNISDEEVCRICREVSDSFLAVEEMLDGQPDVLQFQKAIRRKIKIVEGLASKVPLEQLLEEVG